MGVTESAAETATEAASSSCRRDEVNERPRGAKDSRFVLSMTKMLLRSGSGDGRAGVDEGSEGWAGGGTHSARTFVSIDSHMLT